MKRILTLFFVGILLLPSLFACGAEAPQATTAPHHVETESVTAPTPAIEIGESGSTHEEYQIEIVEHAWSEEEAWLILQYTSACAKNLRNWDLFVQKKCTVKKKSDQAAADHYRIRRIAQTVFCHGINAGKLQQISHRQPDALQAEYKNPEVFIAETLFDRRPLFADKTHQQQCANDRAQRSKNCPHDRRHSASGFKI